VRLLVVVVVEEEVWRLWDNDITPDYATPPVPPNLD
jgi:hypothetical protein